MFSRCRGREQMVVSFLVRGEAKPKGSFVAGKRKDGGAFVRHANPGTVEWGKCVKEASRIAMGHGTKPRPPFTGPVKLIVRFYMPRPKSHYRTNGELHYWAPLWKATRADLDKLLRNLGDSLSPYCIKDDAQIAHADIAKVFVPAGQSPYASVEIREIA